MTLVGLTVHAVLLLVSPTVPANPSSAVIVTVEVPELPALSVTIVGLALIVKS